MILAGYSAHLLQVKVVQNVNNAIHQINHYQADSVVCFIDITGQRFIQWIALSSPQATQT